MNNLLFFTCHKQFPCFEAWSTLLQKNNFLKTFDVITFNDTGVSEAREIAKITENFPKKPLVLSTPNVGGYILGLFKDLSICYDYFVQYDYVFHIHPDVYILNDSKLEFICEKNKNDNNVFFTSLYTQGRDVYNTDFFIFKPKLLNKNIFLEAEEELNKLPNDKKYAEKTFYNLLHKHNINILNLERYPNNLIDGKNRDIDQLNILHTHQKLVL